MASPWERTARPNPRAEYLAVAVRLFAERGASGVTLDDIASASGVGESVLQRHFATRDAVLTELLIESSERLSAGAAATAGEPGSADARVAALIALHVDFVLAERDLVCIQERELAALPPYTTRWVRRLRGTYAHSWVEAVAAARPECPAAEIELRVHAALGLLQAASMHSTPAGVAGVDQERARTLLTALAHHALLEPVAEPSNP